VTLISTVLDDTSKIVPIGGIAALFLVMLKMVWSNDETQRRNETRLRNEFKAERDAEDLRHNTDVDRLRIEFQTSIDNLKAIHSAELESLNRRITMLRDEAREAK